MTTAILGGLNDLTIAPGNGPTLIDSSVSIFGADTVGFAVGRIPRAFTPKAIFGCHEVHGYEACFDAVGSST
ncbi:MAG: hypothetical protein JKY60_12440 [Kordiimonadaceae bacterium]|nr:hypothetical protein [Kordiimonadaceae bacterium]